MMLSEEALLDSIFQAALKGCDVDIKARKEAIWYACIAMMGDVLRHVDPFTRERMLHGLVPQLRESVAHLDELLRPQSSPWPTTPPLLN